MNVDIMTEIRRTRRLKRSGWFWPLRRPARSVK